MDDKILGIDLGTNSLGIAVRDIHLGDDLNEQISYYSSDIFKAGMGKKKKKVKGKEIITEYSYAFQRTKARQSRRLYDTRRRKLWATLDLLIEHGLCPLPKEKLNTWKTYDKNKGVFRKYPEDDAFERWISLDFNGDGVADFSSPYQLRELLVTEQLNMSQELNRYMLGRALYHIAQHRGFKSSKGETIKDTDTDQDLAAEMKKSEEKKSNGLSKFMQQHNAVTAGQAFAILEREGERIRNNAEYVAVRSQLRDEIIQIFRFQNDLDESGVLLNRLISTKKGEGTIFYKKPLRSQKGLVGKCTLERNKPRCPICHPAYEEFRVWSVLNNIQYCPNNDNVWQDLSLELKQMLYHDLFISRVKSDFPFKEIREKLQQKLGVSLFNEGKEKNINYRDYQSIGGCPVTARMIKLLGEDWENFRQPGNKSRSAHTSKKSLEQHNVEYSAWDIWNVCFTTDEPEEILEFAQRRLGWDEEKTKLLLRLWSSMSQGYAMLSLKAIRLINAMLRRGLRYNDAVMMAKLPQLVTLSENEIDTIIVQFQSTIKPKLFLEKAKIVIANSLIAEHKSLIEPNRFALDYEYELQESDYRDIENAVISNLGEHKWSQMDADEQTEILDGVASYYQEYFHDHNRAFITLPRLEDDFKRWLKELFPSLTDKKLNRLYHHSNISPYSPQHAGGNDDDLRLGSPNVGSIKNPVVMRALHVLKNKINAMLDAGIISTDDTRVVIEMTRVSNDANMRWAINQFQEIRKSENKAIRDILQERYPHRLISDQDVDAARYKIEQHEDINSQYASGKQNTFSHDIKKYKLWLEQDCQCMYTGRVINITNLFNDNEFDIEHTIPRSKSFDNSDMNLTICESYYNRFVKKNQLPSQLPNFEKSAIIGGKSYSAIKPRLKKWEEMVEHLKQQVEFWKKQSRRAADKDRKDLCVRQRHLWQMELNYWSGKLKRFTMTEVPDGFRNSQLVDTGIITRHAVMYLKTIFKRVDVQKGEVTSVFRKVLGIQTMDEKKNRDLHSHHAIDAIVLTTIPVAAQRERMLRYFYQIQEMEQEKHDASYLKTMLEQEKNSCVKCKNVQGIVEKVQNTLLVNHISKDQTLTPSRKYKRSRGRLVLSDNQKGEKVPVLMTGESVRKKLHKETYVGAIMTPKTTVVNGEISCVHDENGNYVYDEEQTPTMVCRINLDIKSFKKIGDLDNIIDIRLRERIKGVISERMNNQGMTFAEALAIDIWPFNSKGEQIKEDKNGRSLRSIRHVRAKYKAGPAFLTFKKAMPIKKLFQTSSKNNVHLQDKDYKRFLYAQNDSNYLFLLYEGIKKGKLVRKSRIINYFEFTKWLKECSFANPSINSLFNDIYYNCFQQRGVTYKLTTIIKKGYRVIFWESDPNEVASLSCEELSKRLFVVYDFNTTSADHIYLRNHLFASDDNNLELVPDKLNCLIEHRDFEIDRLGKVHFYE